MDRLKTIHSTILDGGSVDLHIGDLKTSIANTCQDITQANACRDENHLVLSILVDLLRESHKNTNYKTVAVEVIPKELSSVLVRSFSSGNGFTGFLASKVLTLLLAHSALRNEAIHTTKTLIDDLSDNRLSPFERQQIISVLTLLYSRKKIWPDESEQTQEIHTSRKIVLGFLQPSWSNIVRQAVSLTTSWTSVDVCSFASLWKKIIKFADSLDERSERVSRNDKWTIFTSSVEQCFSLICAKGMDGVALCQILKVCNSCLQYSEKMSSRQQFQAHHFHLVDVVHTSIRQGLLGQIPSDQLTFTGTVKMQNAASENSYVLHRQVALLIIKSCAMTTLLALEDKSKSDLSLAGKHMLQINSSLLSLWSWLREETSSSASGHWLLDVFADQDNALLESMLCLMDVYINVKLKKLPTSSPFLLRVINPHICFINFLQNLSFDHSVLLDFLSSPETCFLLYFIKYLHFVVRDWVEFKETCENFNVDVSETSMESSESVISGKEQDVTRMMGHLDDLDKLTTNTQEDLLKLLRRVNTERILLSQQASCKTIKQNVQLLSSRNKDVEKAVASANRLLDQSIDTSGAEGDVLGNESSVTAGTSNALTLNQGPPNLTDYSDSDNDDEDPQVASTFKNSLLSECSKYLEKDVDVTALGELIHGTKLTEVAEVKELPKLTDYPSSDEELETEIDTREKETSNKMDDNELSEVDMNIENRETTQNTAGNSLANLQLYASQESLDHMDTADSSLNVAPEGTDKVLAPSSDSTLDRVMSTVIRLRIVLERLADKQLFPYNAKPLINVLEQCEVRYEEN